MENRRQHSPHRFARRLTGRQWSLVCLGLALIIGACLRFYHLDQNPQGVHPDEALYGYEGWSIKTTGCDYRKTGCPPLYLQGYSTEWDNRTSVLYPYMFSVLWRLVPMNDWWLRFPSVMVGMAMIGLIFAIGRRLFPQRPLISGLAALLLAVSPVAVAWSRVGHDPITVPLFAMIIVYAVLRGQHRPWWYVVAGFTLALGLYSYQPFKLVGPAVFALTLWYAWPGWSRSHVRWLAITAGIGLLVGAPFFYNQIHNWSIVQRQFNVISVFHFELPGWRIFWNFDQYIFSIFTIPAISLLFVPVFAVLVVVRRPKNERRLAWFLSGWLVIGMMPALLTVWRQGSNEMQSRAVGTSGPLELMASFGLVVVVTLLGQLRRFYRILAIGVLSTLLLFSGVMTAYTNRHDGGWCCFVLGGTEEVATLLQRPEYADRPVVFELFHFMQSVNLLWVMKIPPADVQSSRATWLAYTAPDGSHEQMVTHVGRYTLCTTGDCYQRGTNALYVVPADKLPGWPVIKRFTLHFLRFTTPWKIVDAR